MAPPPRDLSGLTLTAEPALTALANVPSFGAAWSRLPSTASPRSQFLAHEADLDLIYAAGRTVDLMPRSEEGRYIGFAGASAVRAEEGNRAGFLDMQVGVSAMWKVARGDGGSYAEAWRRASVEQREQHVLKAVEHFSTPLGKWVWMLFGPEIRLGLLCGGKGEGLGELFERFCVRRIQARPNPPSRFPNSRSDGDGEHGDPYS